ncbi:2-oxoglutarate dehydrogenase E1 component [Agriterribacter sp.]|uniref:2-oxoglutarate dehydrogenase E1 component n=1 Tax=Agriterribacter sp. TaxID=2821509 RepID=UPI002CB2BACD|nr:2-oxoglutarate dehydrogenase E1 component [Agriterribacter sp.]HRO44430.1 2-oxoglutarate dehydrogenase E1 component [Agriterribacter sp.]HRQ19217.1 2-oxoglutarate dehydrogenase E1 component [Agriterribacter sp.]
MKDFSYITSSDPAYIENLYNNFVKDPESVDPDFKKFFEGFDFAIANSKDAANGNAAYAVADKLSAPYTTTDGVDWKKELGAYRLILGYRNKGHLIANTNPIRKRKDRGANLSLGFFGFSEEDMDKSFFAGNLIGLGTTTLRKILEHLQACYAGHVGIEFKYISDQKKVDWLTTEMERNFIQPFSLKQKERILEKINQAVMFEKFLHTKYIGQKRFSLEGGETTIPALDAIINKAAEFDVQEVVIGMAHRGRLNVLANIMGKTYEQIFSEFEGTGKVDQTMGSGDVKYHLGFGSEVKTPGGRPMYLKLMPNPSHLEAVDPVVVGFARGRANILHEEEYEKVLPILIHGDASIAGQGIVYEVLQMCKLEGYYTGGTIHFVINNQIGFTTDFDDARSSDYCTSLAAMVQAPVLHVNGDDPEAVVKCAEIAARYRKAFQSDVFIDMVCYRKHGHNEGDDPKFTQPTLYALIDKHPNPREVYVKYLLEHGEPEAQELAKGMEKKFWDDLQDRLDEVKQNPLPYTYQQPDKWWKQLRKATDEDFEQSPVTAISGENFTTIFNAMMKWPENFTPLRKVEKIIHEKIKLFDNEKKLDWATGELLAYGSILLDGKDVRMSGQDICRGTFSHRHAVLQDEKTDQPYNRLSAIPGAKGKYRIFNSFLSEYGVLGFEYGFGLANPNALVVWEAQFGDFCNVAQPMIDQFISSGEEKWNRMNGITMLLPHGYEGQGPEHSSGRMERFLQMCAELNMVVTNVTIASNFFHALRRQVAWPFRKPLINFSPKANLRHTGSYSSVEEFTSGRFREVIDDPFTDNAAGVKKVIFCSGKIYFDLAAKQQKDNRKDVALVRVEQLYPLPFKQLSALYGRYNKAIWYWVQEEPLNMGAASFLQMNLNTGLRQLGLPEMNYGVISRESSASPATGFSKIHAQEQGEIIETAFSI